MEFESFNMSLRKALDYLENGELYMSAGGGEFTKVTTEMEVSCLFSHDDLWIKGKSYKGACLPDWVHCLTWDKNGKCFAWCCGAKLINNSKDFPEWLDRDDGLVCFVKELTREPFTDDSWKDSLIKL